MYVALAKILLIIFSTAALGGVPPDGPFEHISADYLGRAIVRPGTGDVMPSVMYDQALGSRAFQMWWLGGLVNGEPDIPPFPAGGFEPTDRIYYSYRSETGPWSAPKVVLKGSGAMGPLEADDHLVGSPSVIRIGSKYFMFYEAYSNWVTPINRFYSPSRDDTWISHGAANVVASTGFDGSYPVFDYHTSYVCFEGALGFVPRFLKADTHPIYGFEGRYEDGKLNRFCSTSSNPQIPGLVVRPLNGGIPLFWLYSSSAPGRHALYAAFRPANRNSFVTTDPQFEGGLPDGFNGVEFGNPLLGFAATSLNGPDMVGCDQNRICMATSVNGEDWVRFSGPARGGAIVAPANEQTVSFTLAATCAANPGMSFDLHRAGAPGTPILYGAGYPSALVRDGRLEIYYFDDSAPSCAFAQWRVTLPVSQIEVGSAYSLAGASRECGQSGGWGSDIKWSPMLRRYFSAYIREDLTDVMNILCPLADPNFRIAPTLYWSSRDPAHATPPIFSADQQPDELFPTSNAPDQHSGRGGLWGAIASTPLGHTLDFPDANPPYTAFHIFYSASPIPAIPDCSSFVAQVQQTDLDHILVFGYPNPIPPLGPCPGNANTDSVVDFSDVSSVLTNWLANYSPGTGPGDANSNGVVDFNDITAILTNWLATCP